MFHKKVLKEKNMFGSLFYCQNFLQCNFFMQNQTVNDVQINFRKHNIHLYTAPSIHWTLKRWSYITGGPKGLTVYMVYKI